MDESYPPVGAGVAPKAKEWGLVALGHVGDHPDVDLRVDLHGDSMDVYVHPAPTGH